MLEGTPTSWSYPFIRLLFKFVLKIFYGTIVVENANLIPKTGQPCIVCANHSNSLTDALLLVAAIPSKSRNMLRLTAKSTLFGQKNFTSWLIESAGTVPIQRRKDTPDGEANNSDVMEHLKLALEKGDAICLFPEGMSRYHPTIAPLKTGVARIVSEVLSRNSNNPGFEISLLTCSITYMHRQHFRSDVLLTFHAPMKFRPKDNPELLAPVDHNEIRQLTSRIHQQISSGTIDSPSWNLVRIAKLASRIYAPLGTRMSLGDYVRVERTFLEAFKTSGNFAGEREKPDSANEIVELCQNLVAYHDQLARWQIKDDRVRRPLNRRTMISRIIMRLGWSFFLISISVPGLFLWVPVFATTFYVVHNFKKTGPIWNTRDEIAQYKLTYGLISGLCVWSTAVVVTFPFAPVTFFLVPTLMWLSLRWLEDAISAFRAFTALIRLLCVGKLTLKDMREKRADLHSHIMKLAVQSLGLPNDPEVHFTLVGGRQKGRVSGKWESTAGYFSVMRRRKRDWNETLRWYDKVEYPEESL